MARYSTLQLITPPTFTNKLVLSSTGTFTVPEGITVIRASVQGAGGTGSGVTGGAGGGFAQKILTVRPGCSYCIVSASSAGAYSCFTGICATGATTSPGSGTGGDINNSGGSGKAGAGTSDKTGNFYSGGGGGSGGGRSGPGITATDSTSSGCTSGCGGRGAVGTGGAVGGFTGCCGGAAILAGNPVTIDIGFESGGGGGGQGVVYNSPAAAAGGYGSGGGGCGCCNSTSNRGAGSGGRGFVVVEF